MLVPILVTVLIGVITLVIFLMRSSQAKQIFFVGPHSTGKTEAILALQGLSNSTVTTLASHKIILKDMEVYEIVPKDTEEAFIEKFGLNKEDSFVFFLKNAEEIEEFPDLSGIQVEFVIWKKNVNKNNKNVIYLEESKDNLIKLLRSIKK